MEKCSVSFDLMGYRREPGGQCGLSQDPKPSGTGRNWILDFTKWELSVRAGAGTELSQSTWGRE